MTDGDSNRLERSTGTHLPVLLAEVLNQFPDDLSGRILIDGTFGGGGYTRALLERGAHVVALDLDPAAQARADALMAEFPTQLTFVNGSFADLPQHLIEQGIKDIEGAVFDLGISSYQLDDPVRGLAFRLNGPLDMRLGDSGDTAADLLNGLPEKELADLFYKFADERRSRQLAKLIVVKRRQQKFATTGDFLAMVEELYPGQRRGQRHPAQRLFQALRMAVNDELQALEKLLQSAPDVLAKDGVMVVVSFHSAEDRLVKQHFKALGQTADYELLTKKPIVPSDQEIHLNPRARSGKLRAIRRAA